MLRVILDFSRCELQRHKFVWFAVDVLALPIIKSFKDCLREKFKLVEVELYVKNALLRDEDTICLLRDDDVVRVVQKFGETLPMTRCVRSNLIDTFFAKLPQNSLKKQRISSSNAEIPIVEDQEQTVLHIDESHNQVHSKKRKRKKKKEKIKDMDIEIVASPNEHEIYDGESIPKDLSSICSLVSKPSQFLCSESSHRIETSFTSANNFQSLESSNVTENKKKLGLETDLNASGIVLFSNDKNDNSSVPAADNLLSDLIIEKGNQSDKKRYRKRRRMRSHRKKPVIENESNSTVLEVFEKSNNSITVDDIKASPNLTTETNNGISKKSVSINTSVNKHIIFMESSEESDGDDPMIISSVVEYSSLCEKKKNGVSTPESNSLISLDQADKSLENSSTICSSPKRIKVPSVNSSISNCEWACNSSVAGKKPSDQEISKYTPLHILPSVGSHIAYKMLELNDMYCPEVSDYKKGVVKKVDSHGNIEIELLQEEVKAVRCGKFENIYPDESEPTSEIIKMVTLNWNEMIEPQVMKSN